MKDVFEIDQFSCGMYDYVSKSSLNLESRNYCFSQQKRQLA